MMTLSAIWLLLLGTWAPELIKMLFRHNLHHMAPFGILEAGFCMVFRCASFSFWAPGTHFGTPGPKIGPGIWKLGPGWPGEVFGPNMGVEKTWFCEGMVSKIGIMGFPATRMDCMVPRRPLGKPVSPQTHLKMVPSTFPYFGKFGEGPPCPPCVSPMGPLWALSLSNSRSTTRGGLYVIICSETAGMTRLRLAQGRRVWQRGAQLNIQ